MRSALRLLIVLSAAVSIGAPAAWSAGELSGTGAVRAKDVVAGTVQIEDQVYRIGGQTRIRDVNGRRLALSGLPVPTVPETGLIPLSRVQMGRYDAVLQGGKLVLRSLDLIENPQ